MKKFLDNDFLLYSNAAKFLYHNYAKKMPIIDYHCHVSPKQIACDYKYDNLTEIWLGDDHYKWRALRINGVDERFITGDASAKEKFMEWARTMPKCVGNPLYHWSHMELKKYFNVDEQLNRESAERIYTKCNEKLRNGLTVQRIIKESNVEVICTTDDPCDTLEYHKQIIGDKSLDVKVYPSFRPDKALNISADGYTVYLKKIGEVSKTQIVDFDSLCKALRIRLEFFCSNGCRISDHALEDCIFEETTPAELDKILKDAINGEKISAHAEEQYKTSLLLYLAKEYKKRNIVMQIHFGCIRNLNEGMFSRLGPDKGFDGITNTNGAKKLARFLNVLDIENKLPKIILYSLNQNDNEWLSSISGCFNEKGVKAKVQIGSAWWFNDTKTGILKQLSDYANFGVLGNFVGMLTDSRSFLSYVRHEYFRRIVCSFLGDMMYKGEFHYNLKQIGLLVQDICYNNAKEYFDM